MIRHLKPGRASALVAGFAAMLILAVAPSAGATPDQDTFEKAGSRPCPARQEDPDGRNIWWFSGEGTHMGHHRAKPRQEDPDGRNIWWFSGEGTHMGHHRAKR